MGQEVFSSSVRYTVYQHLEVLLERQQLLNLKKGFDSFNIDNLKKGFTV